MTRRPRHRARMFFGAAAVVTAAALAAGIIACRRAAPPTTDGGRASGTASVSPPAPNGADATPASPPGSLRDEVGRLVTPRALPARRVVSLAPNITELMFAVGAGDQLVGVDRYSDQPAGPVDRLPKVGSNYDPSLERIAALAPDIVFLSKSANKRETADALARMGVPSFITQTTGLGDMPRTLRDVGLLTGHVPEADRETLRLERGFAALRARTRDLPRPRVLVAVWTTPLYVGGRGTFTDDLVEVAGGENVAREVQGFVTFPMERVLHLAPEVIILPTHAPETAAASAVAAWQRWSTLPAVKNGRVFAVEDSIVSRPGARLVEGAELLARLLHPELASPRN